MTDMYGYNPFSLMRTHIKHFIENLTERFDLDNLKMSLYLVDYKVLINRYIDLTPDPQRLLDASLISLI